MAFENPDQRALNLLAGSEGGFALSLLNASPDCIKLLDLDGRVLFMNGNGLCAMEIDDFRTVEGRPWPILWPEAAHRMLTEALDAARQGGTTRFEAFCPTARGTSRWWHVTVSPVRDATGRLTRIMAASRDVTEIVEGRQRLEAEVAQKDAAIANQQVLLGEIDHRVKNSFAAVIALLRMQARQHHGQPAGALLVEAANRISTLARVHDQLHLDPGSRDIGLSDYIRALAADLAQALNAPVRVEDAVTCELRVPPAQAAAIGQILAELIGNAVKHARPGTQAGLWMRLEHDEGLLTVSLEDDGPGLPAGFDPATRQGLGMQICLIYARQMGGDLTHGASARGGARFDVTLRLDPAATS